MLALSALAVAQQAVDASAEHFECAGAYQLLHTHLVHQSFRHVGDNNEMTNIRELLHCQLQAGGRPSSPSLIGLELHNHLNDLLA